MQLYSIDDPDDAALRTADTICTTLRVIFFWVTTGIRFIFVLGMALSYRAIELAMDPRTRRFVGEIAGVAVQLCGWCREALRDPLGIVVSLVHFHHS
jgi:hypothetical protein